MKRNYITNCDLSLERVNRSTYERIRKITAKWEPLAIKDRPDVFSGNFASGLSYDLETKKVVHKPKSLDVWSSDYVGIYEVIPSALMLYRLLCLFKCEVDSEGPEGYKLVWSITLTHKKTGTHFMFYEWKGGITMGVSMQTSKLSKNFQKDILELINALCAQDCPHPYDGTVAGSVA